MVESQRQIQLGKSGVTDNFISTLENHFKKVKIIRISVLKNCCRDRQGLKKITKDILDKLGKNYVARIIGFTIVVMKFRKPVR